MKIEQGIDFHKEGRFGWLLQPGRVLVNLCKGETISRIFMKVKVISCKCFHFLGTPLMWLQTRTEDEDPHNFIWWTVLWCGCKQYWRLKYHPFGGNLIRSLSYSTLQVLCQMRQWGWPIRIGGDITCEQSDWSVSEPSILYSDAWCYIFGCLLLRRGKHVCENRLDFFNYLACLACCNSLESQSVSLHAGPVLYVPAVSSIIFSQIIVLLTTKTIPWRKFFGCRVNAHFNCKKWQLICQKYREGDQSWSWCMNC